MTEPRPTLSLVVNTRNEELHLAAMLASASGCDEIVVADMESTDATLAIARRHEARVLQLPDAGCCEPGRQAAIDAASCDWILVLDADERLSPGGVAAVRRTIAAAPGGVAAFRLYRDTFVGETQVLRSGWDPEIERHVRLFRRGRVAWPARIHAPPQVDGEVGSVPRDEVRIVHHNFEDLEAFQAKLNRYTTIEARQMLARGEGGGVLEGLREGLQELVHRYAPDEDGALSVALSFGLFGYRLFARAKAGERRGWPAERVPSRAALERGVAALWAALREDLVERRPRGIATGDPTPAPATPAPAPARASGEASGEAAPPARSAPLVSIVLPVHDQVAYTRNCLEWLARTAPGELYELVVVDDASTDDTPALLAQLEGDVRVVTMRENVGFVAACNEGAAAARGKYLLFLNNDTAPQENWLTSLVETAEADPEVGAVGARLVFPDGRLQEAGGIIFADGTGWNFGRGDHPFRPEYDRPCEVDYCSGAALLVRRDLFEQLGGFDPRYRPAYYEDTDLCFGIRSLGKRVVYCPRSIVVHYEGISNGTDPAAGFKRYQERNRPIFVEKWREALRAHEPPPSAGGRIPTTADRRARRRPPPPRGDGPSVLVIDPFMPLFDRASGSRRLLELLRLMRRLDARITFVARDGAGQERYEEVLRALGIETYRGDPDGRGGRPGAREEGPRLDLPALLAERRFDVAWLSFWYIAAQYAPAIRAHSPRTRVILDTVDVHFVRELREAELRGDPHAKLALLTAREREIRACSEADAVVTVTEPDRAVLRDAGVATPIAVVPNVHPAHTGAVRAFGDRRDLLFVGNFVHAPNVDAVRWFCAEVLPAVRARIPDVRLFVVGNGPPPSVQALACPHVTVTGWVESTEPHLDACRVSVAPLRYGAGMKGKIGEALARGLPVVSTGIGAEGMDLRDGVHALIADDPRAFAEAIVRLYRDEALWTALSAAGRRHVDERYGPATVGAALEALLRAPLTRAGAAA